MISGFALAERAAPGMKARWSALPPNLRGTLLLVLAFFIFTFEVVAARMLGPHLPVEQLVLVRSAAQLVVVIPFVMASGLGLRILRTRKPVLHALRGIFSVAGLYFYFYSFAHLPLADATTISFTKALFLVLLAGLVLGERVGGARWTATLVGFLGVLIVMRPGLGGVDAAAIAGVLGALTGAGLLLCTKLLAAHETPLAIMVYVALITTSASLVPGLLAWKTPDLFALGWLAVIGLSGPLGQYVNILAFRVAEASTLAPVDYVRLIYSGAAGFLLFAEVPDFWTVTGAAVIVASTFFLTRCEARRARVAAPSSPAGPDPLSPPSSQGPSP